MNKYKEAIEVIDTLLHLMCGEEREDGYKPTMEEMSNSMDLLKDLANKADAFEWIPVTERLPEEHDSVFAKLYGTDKWTSELWRKTSNIVIATIKYNDGRVIVEEAFTHDGEWIVEKKNINCKVIAWMPLPKPYKEKENDCQRNV